MLNLSCVWRIIGFMLFCVHLLALPFQKLIMLNFFPSVSSIDVNASCVGNLQNVGHKDRDMSLDAYFWIALQIMIQGQRNCNSNSKRSGGTA